MPADHDSRWRTSTGTAGEPERRGRAIAFVTLDFRWRRAITSSPGRSNSSARASMSIDDVCKSPLIKLPIAIAESSAEISRSISEPNQSPSMLDAGSARKAVSSQSARSTFPNRSSVPDSATIASLALAPSPLSHGDVVLVRRVPSHVVQMRPVALILRLWAVDGVAHLDEQAADMTAGPVSHQ
jgi:hypothetical protein